MSRLLFISNRLPVTITKRKDKFTFKESVGGLVSGLSAYLGSLKSSAFLRREYLWIGWPGISLEDKKMQDELKQEINARHHAYPVFLSADSMDNFYQGFCNKIIWPIFHYFTNYAIFREEYWNHYKSVNNIFCETVLETAKENDIIWIHDYHLMLLPRLIRERMPSVAIGFFLHIPFPGYEIFRLIPRIWTIEILNGLLGSDLIGFHTYDYTQYFLRCVLRILGHEHDMGQIVTGNRAVKVGTFPMGIDFDKFHNAANSPRVSSEKEKLKNRIRNFKIILSVDRLDYSKGIINRLEGYKLFLEKNPSWHKKVVLLLVVVPSRVGVEHYRETKKKIDELVGNINGRFGSVDWTPILYQYKYVPFHQLVALYCVSDVAMVTPLRDGMNLIAKEYIASRTDGTGVLVLSEMAGAAKELGEANIINPNNREEIADVLKESLEMPPEEQLRRINLMQDRLRNYNVIRWADDFLTSLDSQTKYQNALSSHFFSSNDQERLIRSYQASKKRIIFLDYDGTLTTFALMPTSAKPDDEIIKLLKDISFDKNTELVLISGRDKNTMQEWFGGLKIGMVAEHGVWIREKDKAWDLIRPMTNDWISQVRPLIERYVERLPGSFIEEKNFSIVWHYRKADPEMARTLAKEIVYDLTGFAANKDLQVLQGSKVVEIKNAGVNKGTAVLHWLKKDNFDFILAIGDDWTDEDTFVVLPDSAYSIKVRLAVSKARFTIESPAAVHRLLAKLVS